MKNKNNGKENYLERIPRHAEHINWSADDEGNVTLEIENKGFLNRLFQLILKKPKISYIHLDKTGSFIWPLIDGKKNLTELGKALEEKFGEEAHPLYERLAEFFRILDSYSFIDWN